MGRKLLQGTNDLRTTHPQIAKLWHPTLNRNVGPQDVSAGSSLIRWWVCPKGHEHKDTPNHKKSGRGCPVCSNKRIVPGVNDLTTTHPALAKQWHPSRNGNFLPNQVSSGSNKKSWWMCKKGHEWESVIYSRVNSGGCPICSNKVLLPGVNDLTTTHPALAKQWHPKKNLRIKPENVFAGTKKAFWWLCDQSHEWRAATSERSKGSGCPICSGQKLLQGTNDLESTHPELAAEWFAPKNEWLLPNELISGGKKFFWWQCSEGHRWQATIHNRKRGRGRCVECK